ncbi:MAG: flagellin [Leptospiraceae bacterium]|nr:flagellin [Leptospiraceae bacterium]MDW8306671.1 flagellin [Leptospiraceae bacterium]
MQINNNLSALFVTRQLGEASRGLDKSIERLSSGERINRAGDDATNLAVSEKMRTQIRGLQQAERNALTGLSFIQVAEGNMSQVNDILQRIRVLSVQAANGIYSEADRLQIQVEVSQLIQEVDRISTTAEFNRLKILTGNFARNSKVASMFFHVGPNQNQRIRAYIATMNARSFGFDRPGGPGNRLTTVAQANNLIGTVDTALDRLQRNRADLGAYYNRLETTIEALRVAWENMVGADSRIRDTDMALELLEFTKNQIRLQSGTAMLAQANLSGALVLQLLDKV